jgi:LmbE family N-acetylglucosaminyl deacetylase
MWIAAHPDDEALVAPLFARWCRDQHARCTFLVVTRGDAGTCLRVGGCLPDITTVRSSEAGAASQYFGADLLLLSLKDGGGNAPPPWDIHEGGSLRIISTIAEFIQAVAPQIVVTFDPRHGSTCHPDHRAVASIALEAVKLLPSAPTVYLLETRLFVDPEPFALHFRSAASDTLRFDANVILGTTQAPAWNAIVDDMEYHASQFDDRWITAARNVPASDRAVFIAPASSILQQQVSPCQ